MNGWKGCSLCVLHWLLACIAVNYGDEIYSDTWAVHIEGGADMARNLVEMHGFTYIDQIMPDYYHIRHHRVSKRSVNPSPHHHESLAVEPRVRWLEQQVIKKRVKRDDFNDPKWAHMWYLNRHSTHEGLDMNVQKAWDMGYVGQGVVVSILDDGIEKDHPDLKKNYDPKGSYDVNNNDPDPQPRYDYTNENRHGTRCAGEVAAEANNGICSVGVAYEARIGGVRMLDGDVTDAVEAKSLSLNPQHIDVYSASWGPDDDGRTVDGPATLARKAFHDGIKEGRDGKGSIFVWASGNGGRDQDSCNCDGYTNSIYTISISSATEKEGIPWYSEPCSSTIASTYSSGSSREHQIITTDLRKQCTESHTGTSASAPLAAGICALALSANMELTWRDLQHIIVMTARPADLDAKDWVTNGVGRKVSHSFGYGLMDASAMVELALNWTTVPKQHRCEIKSTDSARAINVNGKVTVSLQSDGCRGTENEVQYLEHVQAVVTLSATRRGYVTIHLTSPQGTRSTLLPKRSRDGSSEGFTNWAFMTTHSWGELALGTWKLEIDNEGTTSDRVKATLTSWQLVQYGTASDPIKDQSHHPYSPGQDCKPGSSKIWGNFCVTDCPVSYYAVNETSTPISTPGHTTKTPAANPSTTLPSSTKPSQQPELPKVTATTTTTTTTHKGLEVSTVLPVNGENVTVVLKCESCALGCAKCNGSAVQDCIVCVSGYKMLGDKSCEKTNFINTIKDSLSKHSKSVLTIVVVSLCATSIVIFVVIFAVLQLLESNKCRKNYKKQKIEYTGLSTSDSDDEMSKEKYTLNGNGESVKVQISRPLGDLVNGLPYTNMDSVKHEKRALLSEQSDDEITTFQTPKVTSAQF